MNRFLMLLLAAAVLMGDGFGREAPTVSNRAPAQDDIGYLPPDGSTPAVNPPALAWLPEPEADAYTVQLARDKGFTVDLVTAPRTPYVLYTHTTTLAPGRWWWRYACLDRHTNRS